MKKVLDYIKQFNKKTNISVDKFLYLKQYYMSMYRYYMLCLYDEGYILDPTVYDEGLIRRNLVELKIKGIVDINGIYIVNKDTIKYATYKNPSESQQRFLLLLLNVLTYKEYCFSLDEFYEVYGEDVSLSLKPQGGRVVNTTELKFNKAIARLFVDKDETVEWISIDDYIRELILKELNLTSNGSFDSSLSSKNESKLLGLLFGNHVPKDLDGTYSSLVKDWYNTNSGSILYSVYSSYALEILEKLSELANKYDESIVLMYSTGIFVRKKISTMYTPVNMFGIACGYEDELTDDKQIVNGYTGEGYRIDYLEDEGFNYVGIPVKVFIDDEEVYIFDREQTDIKSVSWFKENSVDFTFEEKEDFVIETEEDAIKSSNQGVLGKYKIIKEETE